MDENETARFIVDKCLKIHKALGPGLGLLINFNEALIKDGITRIVN